MTSHPPRPDRRAPVVLVAPLVLLATAGAIAAAGGPPAAGLVLDVRPTVAAAPAQTWVGPRAAPTHASLHLHADPLWVERTSHSTGVPARALQAYATAQLVVAGDDPGCRASWPTLAAIGWVESRHGSITGGTLDATGAARPRITGPPLTGAAGTARILDSDGGSLDGDARWDRAVGPMQFLPSTWRLFGSDADADRVADPDDVDDAALAAARHLCAAGEPLTEGDAWTRAVRGYNDSAAYVREVHAVADEYATRSRG